ncbi:alpha/beta hydrolase [Leptolyngbya cf. ectocarpi LEGE 11479]|uniref:Alpha/beta hydrolase n=1 Tax=Leptolyngbya cf. ectocarpi LEGE 11479 TaxID=1828722 RepID=A0A928X059_LEPEC|nr:alpha/beta hydrolase [Leptolyngbya ectocarpi]MBE9065436.1 alpha/beta hydrolase [Leptolyngbya cf. ectocarpi LEGE 11479]
MLIEHICLLAVSEVRQELPLLVFLPGMDGSDLSLRQQAAGLKTVFDIRCLIIPENDQTAWVDLVAQLTELVTIEKKSRPDRPIYLCGESFGACLALKTISHRPNLFSGLILINPASAFNRQIWSPLGAFLVQWLPGNTYRLGALGLLLFLIVPERVSQENRQALLHAMQRITPESAAWRLSLLQDFQLNKVVLKQFKTPTLLVASGADRLLPSVAEVQKIAALLPHAQTLTLNHSGHACLLETEVDLYQLLQQAQFMPRVKV